MGGTHRGWEWFLTDGECWAVRSRLIDGLIHPLILPERSWAAQSHNMVRRMRNSDCGLRNVGSVADRSARDSSRWHRHRSEYTADLSRFSAP